MAHSCNTRAKNLEPSMSHEALAKLKENIINNINNLKDEVLDLKGYCDKEYL